MPKHSAEQYLEVMAGVGNNPLRHTVMFESSTSPSRPIRHVSELLVAIDGMRRIPGVSPRIVAARSSTSPNVVEEITLANPDALQGLRHNADHDKVLAHAMEYTNWLVVDRVAPKGHELEGFAVKSAVTDGHNPVMSHLVMAVPEESGLTAENLRGRIAGVMAEAAGSLVVPSEVEISLDHRKGDVVISRNIWAGASEMVAFAQSAEYAGIMSDIADSNMRMMQALHPIAA